MSSFAKIAVGLAFALPLTAYVVGTLAGAEPAPAEHAPIILDKSTGPANPSPRPGTSSGPRDGDPEVVAPRPVESDDDDWDDERDDRDEQDDRGRGGERDDDRNDD